MLKLSEKFGGVFMNRLFKSLLTLLLATCCCFLVCCAYYPTDSENSSVNKETCNHNYTWSTLKESTCTTSGIKMGTCSKCLKIEYYAIDLIPHDYNWIVLQEPTCTTPGIKMNRCSICLKGEPQSIDLIPHDYSAGTFCKMCDTMNNPDFYVPDNFNGGLTIKEINNKLALFGYSLNHFTQIEISHVYINNNGIVKFLIGETTLSVSDLQCDYPVTSNLSRTIRAIKIRKTSQLNVYVVDSTNQETYIGSLDGTGKIERLFVNENNDLFVVYSHNATIKIGTLNMYNSGEFDNLIYRKIAGKNEYAVIGITQTEDEHIKIPDTHNGLPVTLIENYAFEANQNIKSVQIGQFVNTIGAWAFWKCSSLVSVYLPNSSLKIDNGAFYRTNLTTIYYQGSQKDKNNNIIIPTFYNQPLFECNWIYNYNSNN